jgi:hypothetical protein
LMVLAELSKKMSETLLWIGVGVALVVAPFMGWSEMGAADFKSESPLTLISTNFSFLELSLCF